MSYKSVAVLVLACICLAEMKPQSQWAHGVGYYWRDYEGYVPADALAVAPNVYIAQVFANGVIKPAYIDQEKRHAVYLHQGHVHTTYHQIKILCSPEPSQFEWVKTDTASIIKMLPTRNFIYGGQSQNGKPYFIGRSHDHHVVGMVAVYSDSDGLHYPLNGHGVVADEFDVYVYKN